MHNLFIGVDLHKHQFTCCFLSEKGKEMHNKYATNPNGYRAFFRHVQMIRNAGYSILSAVESTGNTRYFKNQLEKNNIPLEIVNTMKFKVVNESVNKTDKRDAKTIAYFLMKDMLPKAILGSEKSERFKRLLNTRNILVRSNVKLKNQIHGILLGLGIDSRRGQLNSKKGRHAIIDQIEDESNREIVSMIISHIENIMQSIKSTDNKLDKMAENDKVVSLLKTIPGTGMICAITVRAYIDDINRFKSYPKLSSYSGLVPWVQCSDKKEYYGKITKRGPRELRTALIQMVLGMIRCKSEKNNRFMNQYRYFKKNKGSGKSLVALARKFTKLIWTMLTNNEEYDPGKLSLTEVKVNKSENYTTKLEKLTA